MPMQMVSFTGGMPMPQGTQIVGFTGGIPMPKGKAAPKGRIKVTSTEENCRTFLNAWMKRVNSRDMVSNMRAVELYYTVGSGLDWNLFADPYVHELMRAIVAVEPSLNPGLTHL